MNCSVKLVGRGMIIYNYCSRCGRKIKTARRDSIISLSLKSTRRAICSDCDPHSKWVPVYPTIEGEGKLGDWGYKVIETEVGKGLLLTDSKGRSMYLAPLTPKKELKHMLSILPNYVREALSEFELVKKIELSSIHECIDKNSLPKPILKPTGEEKLPVSESLKVIQGITLYKTEKWWSAVTLLDAFGRRQIGVYLWIKRGERWKRKNKFIIHNKAEWQQIKRAVEKLFQNLP